VSVVVAINEQLCLENSVHLLSGLRIVACLTQYLGRPARAILVASALMTNPLVAQRDSSSMADIRAAAAKAISHVNWCEVIKAVERTTKRGPSSSVAIVSEIAIHHTPFWSEPNDSAEVVQFTGMRVPLARECRTLSGPIFVNARDVARFVEGGRTAISLSVASTPRSGGRGWNVDAELASGNNVAYLAQLRVRRSGKAWRVIGFSEAYHY
jgi:hypothetical protein